MTDRVVGDRWITAGYFREEDYDPDFRLTERKVREAQEEIDRQERNSTNG